MNRDTAITQMQLNSGTQINPWGRIESEQTGERSFVDSTGETVTTPWFTQTTSYNPQQQAIFDQSQAAQGNLAQTANQQSSFLKDYLGDRFKFTNDDASQWAMDLASPRIMKQQQNNEATLRSTLANKGIREGSAAWNAELGRLSEANTDQMNQLALTGRAQAFGEQQTMRNQPLNEISALLSGSQLQNPGTASPAMAQAGVAVVDYTGLVNNNYNQQVAAANQGNAAMGGLLGTGLKGLFSISDARLKTEITRVGTLDNGLGVYSYRLMGGPIQIGVMAQEVAEAKPEAVIMGDDGFMRVDYARAVA
jgi:hypothetical protein